MKIEAILIGGPRDGECYVLSEVTPYLDIPEKEIPVLRMPFDTIKPNEPAKIFRYRLETIKANDVTFYLFVAPSFSLDSAIKRLITFYRPK